MAIAPSCCISITTDANYFLPALVTAVQARQHTTPGKADVVIFGFNISAEAAPLFADACARENVLLHLVDTEILEGRSVLLARLILNRFIPEQYTQHLYMDSDLYISGSLDPLIDTDVSGGGFLASNDPFTFVAGEDVDLSREFKQHLQTVGLAPEHATDYFNSGVLRMNRECWEHVGPAAWQLSGTDKGSRFPDQDLLNIVGHAERLPLSQAWNFPIFLRNCGVEEEVNPRVYHFMSNPKPWHGSFPPWNRDFAAPYPEMLARYPKLAPFCPRMPLTKRLLYQVKQRVKRVEEGRAWADGRRRENLRRYEAMCVI